jgi:hypothetical protein
LPLAGGTAWQVPQDGACCGWPVPEAVSWRVGWAESFVARFQHARAAPAAVGAKATVTVAEPPAATVNPVLGETESDAAPALSHAFTALTTRSAVPVLLSVADRVEAWFTVTVPRSTAVGERVADAAGVGGGGVGACPVPEAVSWSVGWAGSFVPRFQHAWAAPVELGAKVTVSVADPPAATVNPALGDTVMNAEPLLSQAATEVTLRGAVPEFVTAAVLLALLPVVTAPRSTAVGARLADGAGVGGGGVAAATVKVGSAVVT